jgi:hypothetical protein
MVRKRALRLNLTPPFVPAEPDMTVFTGNMDAYAQLDGDCFALNNQFQDYGGQPPVKGLNYSTLIGTPGTFKNFYVGGNTGETGISTTLRIASNTGLDFIEALITDVGPFGSNYTDSFHAAIGDQVYFLANSNIRHWNCITWWIEFYPD